MLGTDKKSAYILCIKDPFMKYAVVTKVDNKDAEMVAKAIFNNWFCKFGSSTNPFRWRKIIYEQIIR